MLGIFRETRSFPFISGQLSRGLGWDLGVNGGVEGGFGGDIGGFVGYLGVFGGSGVWEFVVGMWAL